MIDKERGDTTWYGERKIQRGIEIGLNTETKRYIQINRDREKKNKDREDMKN